MRAIRKYFQKYWKYKIQQTKEELNTMKIGNDIYYVGVNDHQVDLFEGQYVVPNGMSYNSYVIKDEKIAVMDTVDAGFTEEWLGKVAEVLDGAKPDYLVVQHMEPDHAANIENFMRAYPDTTVVANTKTFTMMEKGVPWRCLPRCCLSRAAGLPNPRRNSWASSRMSRNTA